MWSSVWQHLAHSQALVTKNKSRGSESILVTNNYIYCKCYLNIFKIVPDRMDGN